MKNKISLFNKETNSSLELISKLTENIKLNLPEMNSNIAAMLPNKLVIEIGPDKEFQEVHDAYVQKVKGKFIGTVEFKISSGHTLYKTAYFEDEPLLSIIINAPLVYLDPTKKRLNGEMGKSDIFVKHSYFFVFNNLRSVVIGGTFIYKYKDHALSYNDETHRYSLFYLLRVNQGVINPGTVIEGGFLSIFLCSSSMHMRDFNVNMDLSTYLGIYALDSRLYCKGINLNGTKRLGVGDKPFDLFPIIDDQGLIAISSIAYLDNSTLKDLPGAVAGSNSIIFREGARCSNNNVSGGPTEDFREDKTVLYIGNYTTSN